MPDFFVPFVEPEKHEVAYKQIAEYVGAIPMALAERIYSMTWRHYGVVWTAIVGEKLRGLETVEIGRRRDRRIREIPRSTEDTVLAIFPGSLGLIAHDNKSKHWNLPILTGKAIAIERF